MDFFNIEISYKMIEQMLQKGNPTPEEQCQIDDILRGYNAMAIESQAIIQATKNALFNLFKQQMTEEKDGRNSAYRMGVILALNEQNIKFIVKDEKKLKKRIIARDKKIRIYRAMYRNDYGK